MELGTCLNGWHPRRPHEDGFDGRDCTEWKGCTVVGGVDRDDLQQLVDQLKMNADHGFTTSGNPYSYGLSRGFLHAAEAIEEAVKRWDDESPGDPITPKEDDK